MNEETRGVPPVCEYCTDDQAMTVEHVLVNCAGLTRARSRWLGLTGGAVNLVSILGEEANVPGLLGLLRDINLLSKV